MPKISIAIVFLFLILSCLLPAYSQSGENQTFELTGKAADDTTGEAVARALVEYSTLAVAQSSTVEGLSPIAKRTMLQGRVFTDGSGMFNFSGLPPGNYNIVVTKPQFESKRENIRIENAARNIQISLSHLAVISGTVTDGDGRPLRGTNIVLFQMNMIDGRRTLTESRSVTTDDLGQYRLWNLQPGHYFLKAVGRGGGTLLYSTERLPSFSAAECFLPVYYGGSADWKLTKPIDFGSKKEAVADFHLILKPARRIRGNVSGITAFQSAKFELLDSNRNVVASRAALSGVGGAFELLDVAPGSYLLKVMQGEAAAKVFGEIQADVSGSDANDVKVSLQSGINVTVVSHCQSAESELKIPCARLMLVGTDRNASLFTASGNLQNIPPGEYEFSMVTFGRYVSSIQAGGQSVRPNQKLSIAEGMGPVEISTADDGGSIEVQIDLPDRRSTTDIAVLAVPLFDTFNGPIRLSYFDGLQMSGFAPGDYSLYALRNADMELLEYRNPEALRGLVPSAAVRVEANGHHKIEIKSLAK